MSDPMPVGVLGVGSMGRHHARIYHELPEVDLVGVSDVDVDAAAAVAAEYDADPLTTEELFERVEAVSIAVPSRFHRDVGMAAIEAGVHVLIEKPIATTVAEAADLVDAAEAAGVTLQVGHVERFNPAVRTLEGFVDDLDVIAVDARRLGPPLEEDRDVGRDVVADLMIHDLDVIRSLVDAPVADVNAVGTAEGEYVSAALTFENGIVATLTASRVTQRKVRELTLTAADSHVTVDYSDRSVSIDRRDRPSYRTEDGDLRYRSEHVVERPTVENGEPLKAELSAFVEAAGDGTEPVVTGNDGVEALRLAVRIRDAVEERRVEQEAV